MLRPTCRQDGEGGDKEDREVRGSKIEDRGPRVEDRGPRIDDGEIEVRGSRIEVRENELVSLETSSQTCSFRLRHPRTIARFA